MIDTTFSHYRVQAKLGEGGMGEVYRARDTTLNRDVAIKVLPAAFATDTERLARFTREAQTLAALNHPHIAAIYGIEASQGVRALVMELVEGDDLSTLIARGPMPLADALPVARQVAEAIEAAHELGIVHRDLKPANIKVRPDGTVKVLDFGLAKAMDAGAASSTDALNSPTLTAALGTRMGVILGTAAYMAPEQAKGKVVDRRADIWAFGVVLYEMLTGTRLFDGETVSDVLAAVLTREPDWKALPASTPSALRRLLERCLDRDPRKRLRDIGEAALLLGDPTRTESDVAATPPRATVAWRERAAWTLVALALAAVAIGLAMRGPSTASAPGVSLPLHVSLRFDPSDITPPSAAIAPDGQSVAFPGRLPGAVSAMVFVRSLHEATARPLTGSEGFTCCLTFSPDGRSIAFIADNRVLKRVPIDGGTATTIIEGNFRFAQPTWADNGTILLAQYDPNQPGVIYRVPEAGGQALALPGKSEHAGEAVWGPRALPGGHMVLFSVVTAGHSAIAVQSIETGERRVIAREASFPLYVGNRLVWVDKGRLIGAPFDEGRLALTAAPVPVPVDGLSEGDALGSLDASATGALLFLRAGTPVTTRTTAVDFATVLGHSAIGGIPTRGLLWIDQRGTRTLAASHDTDFVDLRLSPDGGRVAGDGRATGETLADVWTIDLRRGTVSRLSFGEGEDETAVWSPDGAWIAWASSRVGEGRALYRRRSDGSGNEERLWSAGTRHFHANNWTPDGTGIVVSIDNPKTGWDIALVRLGGTPGETPLFSSAFNETSPRVSPDGHWIAYVSDESGRDEIYTQAFPRLGHRVQVSIDGGDEPVWHPRGTELIYRASRSRHFMAVAVKASGDDLVMSAPREIASDAGVQRGEEDHTEFDVAQDGRLLAPEETPADYRLDIHVVLGWAQHAGLVP